MNPGDLPSRLEASEERLSDTLMDQSDWQPPYLNRLEPPHLQPSNELRLLSASSARQAGHLSYSVQRGLTLLMHDLGILPEDVLRRAQLPGDLFGRRNAWLSASQYFSLWAALGVEATARCDAIPARIGRSLSSDWFDPALFAAMCSANLNHALLRIAKYKRLIAPITLHVESTPQRTTLTMEWLDKSQLPPPVLVGFELIFFVQIARRATRHNIRPISVSCPEGLPQEEAYASYFGVHIGRSEAPTIVFDAEDADRPFLTASPEMWSFFEPALKMRLSELDQRAKMSERVHSALLEALPAGELSVDAVCSRLGVSSRTLQRRLKTEGRTFQQILDQVRLSLALHYLRNSNMSGGEISFLLGFEDSNSFVRAFKVWTGITPQAARTAARVAS